MGVSSRRVEITVMSSENVRVTEDAYVVVRAESLKCCTTRTAKDDGNNNFLSWNEKLLLDVPMHAKSITFELQCNRFKGFRPLGVARIALSDLLPAVPENGSKVFSYGLRDWEGKRNGVIHFTVRMAAPTVTAVAVEKKEEEKCFKGTVVARNRCGFDGGDKKSNEVVVGVPFWWNYPNVI